MPILEATATDRTHATGQHMMPTVAADRRSSWIVFAVLFAVATLFAVYTQHVWEDFYITYRASKNLATGNGGMTNLTGALTTTGTQTYNDNVALTGATTLAGTTPTFGGTVTGGGNDLTLNFSGTTAIDGATSPAWELRKR